MLEVIEWKVGHTPEEVFDNAEHWLTERLEGNLIKVFAPLPAPPLLSLPSSSAPLLLLLLDLSQQVFPSLPRSKSPGIDADHALQEARRPAC